MILMALVVLVLVMACATVGNLLTGQAVARAREMALRVSIGAGRARLIQLVHGRERDTGAGRVRAGRGCRVVGRTGRRRHDSTD